MNKKYILASLYKIANSLDVSGLHKEANSLTNLMKRLAEDDINFDPRQKEFPLDTHRAMGQARVDLSKYQQPEETPKYDYTQDKNLYSILSDFGKKYDDASSAFPFYQSIKKLMDSVAFIHHKDIPSLLDLDQYKADDEMEEYVLKIIKKGIRDEGSVDKFYHEIKKG